MGVAFRDQALCQQPTRHHDEAVPEPPAEDSLLFVGVGNDSTDEDGRPVDEQEASHSQVPVGVAPVSQLLDPRQERRGSRHGIVDLCLE